MDLDKIIDQPKYQSNGQKQEFYKVVIEKLEDEILLEL